MTTTQTIPGIPVRHISAVDLPELIASTRREVDVYEQRYELFIESIVELVDRDAIVPAIDIIKWYHAYSSLDFLLDVASRIGDSGSIAGRPVPKTRP